VTRDARLREAEMTRPDRVSISSSIARFLDSWPSLSAKAGESCEKARRRAPTGVKLKLLHVPSSRSPPFFLFSFLSFFFAYHTGAFSFSFRGRRARRLMPISCFTCKSSSRGKIRLVRVRGESRGFNFYFSSSNYVHTCTDARARARTHAYSSV